MEGAERTAGPKPPAGKRPTYWKLKFMSNSAVDGKASTTAIQYLLAPKGLPPPVSKKLIDAFFTASQTPGYIDIAQKNALFDKASPSGSALDSQLLGNALRKSACRNRRLGKGQHPTSARCAAPGLDLGTI